MIRYARGTQGLLTYLAVPLGQVNSRDKLAVLLWGDMPQRQARASLRQALATIRRALAGVDVLRVDGETVALEAATVAVDAHTFEQRVREDARLALEEAFALYQGDLLAGLAVNEAAFEEWLVGERHRLHELAVNALARLLVHQRAAGAVRAPDAEAAAQRCPPDRAQAVAAYREALAIAEALGMRPLEGRCHLGLAPLLASAGEISGARSHLSRAGELFAALGLDRWRTEAKAVSAELAY